MAVSFVYGSMLWVRYVTLVVLMFKLMKDNAEHSQLPKALLQLLQCAQLSRAESELYFLGALVHV